MFAAVREGVSFFFNEMEVDEWMEAMDGGREDEREWIDSNGHDMKKVR